MAEPAAATGGVVPDDAPWLDLLARLHLACHASRDPVTRAALRALGVRRTGTLGVSLDREMDDVRWWPGRAGVAIDPARLHRRIGELARPQPLDVHLADLVDAYRAACRAACGGAAASPSGHWLACRVRVHEDRRVQLDPPGREDARVRR